MMTDTLNQPAPVTPLIDTYLAAWNEAEEDIRQRLLEDAWADEGEYTDPQSHAINRKGLEAIIGGFHESNPGARFALDGPISRHHRFIRFYWTLRFANGAKVRGMDYGDITEDGKLGKIVGFF